MWSIMETYYSPIQYTKIHGKYQIYHHHHTSHSPPPSLYITYRWIYHDALSTWWSKGAQAYLTARGFANRQWRSLGQTNQGTRYAGKLVGDSPEFMPLDNNLFADFTVSLTANVCVTRHLPSDHPCKFSLADPKRCFDAMRRTWEHSPSSERIVEDICRFPKSLEEVSNIPLLSLTPHSPLCLRSSGTKVSTLTGKNYDMGGDLDCMRAVRS